MQTFLSRLLEPKANGPETAALLASLLKIKLTDSTLRKEIEEHPDYPSLLSVSDVLNKYGVENLGVKLDAERFSEIATPFIAQISGDKSHVNFFTVVKENEEHVTFYDPEKLAWRTSPRKDFLRKSSGVVLLVDADEDAGEEDYLAKIRAERQKQAMQYFSVAAIPVLLIFMGLSAFLQTGTSVLLPLLFSILTLVGCLVSVILLWYELDQYNPVIKKICGAGKKTDCSAVLDSKASKIAGISWSVLGFTYFAGMQLFLLFSGLTDLTALFVLSWLNIAALPYTVFSVYYQWRVARQWCVLCLSVQALLILQAAVSFSGGWPKLMSINVLTPGLIVKVAVAFVIPFIAANVIVPALQKAKQTKGVKNELQRLKHNAQIFSALLEKQRPVIENPGGLGITLGPDDAAYKIIKVCNPYCGPCAAAHKPIEDILHNNPDVQLQVLYIATNDENDSLAPPVKHLLAIAEKYGEEVVKKALDDWYLPEEKDYNVFAAKYPMNGELNAQGGKLDAMHDWCKKNSISYTPTIFISVPNDAGKTNYYEMPAEYSYDDLKYLLIV